MRLVNPFQSGRINRLVDNHPIFRKILDNRMAVFFGSRRVFGIGPSPSATATDHYQKTSVTTDESRARELASVPLSKKISAMSPPTPMYDSEQAADKFNDNINRESFWVYTIGGSLEGLGKGCQRENFLKDWTNPRTHIEYQAFIDHPVAKLFFRPINHYASLLINYGRNVPLKGEELSEALKSLGARVSGWANVIKVIANLWIAYKQRELVKNTKTTDTAKLEKKAAKYSGYKNVAYALEKGSAALGQYGMGVGSMKLAVGAMAANQLAIIIASGVQLVGVAPVIWKDVLPYIPGVGDPGKKSKEGIRRARDNMKSVSLYLTKSSWSISTFLYMYSSHSDSMAAHNGPLSARACYDILTGNNWDLPLWSYWFGIASMVAIPSAFFVYNAYGAAKIVLGKKRKDAEVGEQHSFSYYLGGLMSDLSNALGGIWTANLMWQPLGAIFLGAGSLFGILQSKAEQKQAKLRSKLQDPPGGADLTLLTPVPKGKSHPHRSSRKRRRMRH